MGYNTFNYVGEKALEKLPTHVIYKMTNGLEIPVIEDSIMLRRIDDSDQPGIQEYIYFKDENGKCYLYVDYHYRQCMGTEEISLEDYEHAKEKTFWNCFNSLWRWEPKAGHHVEVVKGRKIPKGTIGYVCAVTLNKFDEFNPQVGIQVEGQILWTYKNNLKVIA